MTDSPIPADVRARAREFAGDVGTRLSQAQLDARAAALAERVRGGAAHLDDRATALARSIRDSDAVALANARSRELSAEIARRLRELPVDEWMAHVGAWLHDASRTLAEQDVTNAARRYAEEALGALGDGLRRGRTGELLGLRPRRRDLIRPVLIGVGAFAAGVAVGRFVLGGRDLWDDELVESADRMVVQAQKEAEATLADRSALAVEIDAALDADPRTKDLEGLQINVIDGTVFVRGPAGSAVDAATIREIVEGIDGVRDVDIEVSADA